MVYTNWQDKMTAVVLMSGCGLAAAVLKLRLKLTEVPMTQH